MWKKSVSKYVPDLRRITGINHPMLGGQAEGVGRIGLKSQLYLLAPNLNELLPLPKLYILH